MSHIICNCPLPVVRSVYLSFFQSLSFQLVFCLYSPFSARVDQAPSLAPSMTLACSPARTLAPPSDRESCLLSFFSCVSTLSVAIPPLRLPDVSQRSPRSGRSRSSPGKSQERNSEKETDRLFPGGRRLAAISLRGTFPDTPPVQKRNYHYYVVRFCIVNRPASHPNRSLMLLRPSDLQLSSHRSLSSAE